MTGAAATERPTSRSSVASGDSFRRVPFDRLHPWRGNFRFPDGLQASPSDREIYRQIAEEDPVDVLVDLIAQGYDDAMPMVVTPESVSREGSRAGHFTVVVGNRRLTAIALLLDHDVAKGLTNERAYQAVFASLRRSPRPRTFPCVVKPNWEAALESVRLSESADIASGKSRWTARAYAHYLDDLWREFGRERALEVARSGDGVSSARVVRQVWAWRLAQLAETHGHQLSHDRFSILSEHLLNRSRVIEYFDLPPSTVSWTGNEPMVAKKREKELTEFLAMAVGSNRRQTVLPGRAYQGRDRDLLLEVFRTGGQALQALRDTGDLRAAFRLTVPRSATTASVPNPITRLTTAINVAEGAVSHLPTSLGATDSALLKDLATRYSALARRLSAKRH
jgi:hypothetical protein